MIRNLLCKLNIHKPKLEVITNTSGKEYCYSKEDKQINVFVILNIKCERCGKVLDSHIVKIKFKEEQTDDISK